MNILITGGAGFIGSHIADACIKEGHQVIILDNLSTGRKDWISSQAWFYQGDVSYTEIWENVFTDFAIDIIIHQAAHIDLRQSLEDPVYDAQVNIQGSLLVLEYAKRYQVQKVVMASTGGAMYGDTDLIPTPETHLPDPLSPYGITKLTMERYAQVYAREFSVPFVVLRYANVYGPRQNAHGDAGVIAIFTQRLLTGEPCFINGEGTNTRDYVYVDDVVQANLFAMTHEVQGIFNVGTGQETSVNKIFDLLQEYTDSEQSRQYRPLHQQEQQRSCLDAHALHEAVGWYPQVALEEGLQKTVDWFQYYKIDYEV